MALGNNHAGNFTSIVFTVILLGISTAAFAQNSVPIPTTKPIGFFEKIKDKFFGEEEEEKSPNVDVAKCKQQGRLSALNKEISLQENASIYKKIFAEQQNGNFKTADTLITQLKDCRLMGHITLQRYLHPTKYKASFTELKNWLDKYADHPAAARIHKLAEVRRPTGNKQKLKKPTYKMRLSGALESALMEPSVTINKGALRSDGQEAEVKSLLREINNFISQGKPSAALDAFNKSESARTMNPYEKAGVRVTVAKSYLIEGKEKRAFALAAPVADKYGSDLPLAGWVSGLISWKRGDMNMASNYFSKIANGKNSNGWMVSAGAYWAGRSYLRLGQADKHTQYLKIAAKYPRTFYGILAVKALGQNLSYNWLIPSFGEEYREDIISSDAGVRAYLLTKSGQYALADSELSGLPDLWSKGMRDAVLAFALHEGLPSFAMLYGNATKNQDDRFYDSALYPLMPWLNETEYSVHPAVVHAFVRQESHFKPRAGSPSGAVGLMQIIPSTAAYVADDEGYKDEKKWKLKDPKTNLEIGQTYIQSLLKMSSIDNSLFHLMIAYNAGPGNLMRWNKALQEIDDPLLFIELVPAAETRAYIERVMRNMWIYEERYGLESPSLKQILVGEWPQYTSFLAR